MLQHNLGLAYQNRNKGERRENLERSIECFNQALEIFTQNEFPEKWKINQEDLGTSEQQLIEFNQLELQKQEAIKQDNDRWHLVKDIIDRPISHRNLEGVELFRASLFDANLTSANLSSSNLIIADLRGANLSNANLTSSNLTGANLSDANLSNADLTGANLSGANLNNTNVKNTQFGSNSGIYLSLKQDLIDRGAVFNDGSEDRSESTNPVPR